VGFWSAAVPAAFGSIPNRCREPHSMTLSRPPEEFGQALGFLCGLYFGDEGLEAAAVLDVVVEHVVLVGFDVVVVEDDGHVRLDGDAGIVAVRQGVT